LFRKRGLQRARFEEQFPAISVRLSQPSTFSTESAERVVKTWMAFHNTALPHSARDRRTPDEAYWAGREEQKAA